MTPSPLTNKIALVTGGSQRVGRSVALHLADAGMDVAITYRHSADEAAAVVDEIEAKGRRGAAIGVDLADRRCAELVYGQFVERFDSLYVLVNNASCFSPSPVDSVSPEQFDTAMAINARGPLLLIQKFRHLLAGHDRPGRIINFIDIHVLGQPLAGYIAYNTSKAALAEITRTCAIELAPSITVNAIAPGVVAWADAYSPPQRRQYLKRVPLNRAGTPEEAAAAVLFLVRDGSYCNGQVLKLDGGRLLT